MSDSEVLAFLKERVDFLTALVQQGIEREGVFFCAVASLVRSHPEPKAFAAAFRRAWRQHGSPHEFGLNDQPCPDGVASALSVLEASCPVPLGIRPPGVADEFEK